MNLLKKLFHIHKADYGGKIEYGVDSAGSWWEYKCNCGRIIMTTKFPKTRKPIVEDSRTEAEKEYDINESAVILVIVLFMVIPILSVILAMIFL